MLTKLALILYVNRIYKYRLKTLQELEITHKRIKNKYFYCQF